MKSGEGAFVESDAIESARKIRDLADTEIPKEGNRDDRTIRGRLALKPARVLFQSITITRTEDEHIVPAKTSELIVAVVSYDDVIAAASGNSVIASTSN